MAEIGLSPFEFSKMAGCHLGLDSPENMTIPPQKWSSHSRIDLEKCLFDSTSGSEGSVAWLNYSIGIRCPTGVLCRVLLQ